MRAKLLLSITLARALAQPAATNAQTNKPPPAVLPGNGLAQHDFLYTGEWDTRKTTATLFLIKDGKVVWTYTIPRKDEFNGQESEFSDIHRLSNGDIVFAYKTGWRKIDSDGKTIYDYRCPKTSNGWTECHSAQPVVCGNFNLAGTNCSYYIAKALLSRSSYNLALAQPGPGTNIIIATGTPGYEYALDLATNLTPPISWQPQTTNMPIGTVLTFTNASTASQGIYRTRYVPQ